MQFRIASSRDPLDTAAFTNPVAAAIRHEGALGRPTTSPGRRRSRIRWPGWNTSPLTVWQPSSRGAGPALLGRRLRLCPDAAGQPAGTVGVICNAVGGSTAESWIDRHTLECTFPDILTDWLQNDFIQEWARQRAART